PSATPLVKKSGLYDYEPSAMVENGNLRIWTCGQTSNHSTDVINAAFFSGSDPAPGIQPFFPAAGPGNPNGDKRWPVLTASSNLKARDSALACSPAVVKHSHPDVQNNR